MGLRLYRASVAGDLLAMARALAEGAEVNGSIGEEEGRTALIGAAVGVSGLRIRLRNAVMASSCRRSQWLVFVGAACRGRCPPASSCCRTGPTSTTET